MNYLETGLPHTQFYRKKTQFSPPRFIPLCGLSRKYQGLEPLTRKEVDILIRRLSEPKKSPEVEEQPSVTQQIRPRSSPGSGRFVGQKKMSTLEIEQMVSRLCNKRSTKDYPYEDDTVEAEDIMRMTNRMDDSSDSEDEVSNIITKEPELDSTRPLFRRHSSAVTLRRESENIDFTRRDYSEQKQRQLTSAMAQKKETCFDESSNKSWDNTFKPRTSPKVLSSHFDTSNVVGKQEQVISLKKMEPAKSWAARVSSERSIKENIDVTKLKPELKNKPSVRFMRGSYFSAQSSRTKPDKITEERATLPTHDDQQTTVSAISIKRPMSYPSNRPIYRSESVVSDTESKIDLSSIFACMNRPCRAAELTRPPPSLIQLFPPSARKNDKDNDPSIRNNVTTTTKKITDSSVDIDQIDTQTDSLTSPRSKFPRIEVSGKKIAERTTDDLLIDQVASYNRTFKSRTK